MKSCSLCTRMVLLGLFVWLLLLFFFFSQTTNSDDNFAFSTVNLLPVRHVSTLSNNTVQMKNEEKSKDLTGSEEAVKSLVKPKRRSYVGSEDWEEYFSNGKKLINGLWMGSVSANMLSVRLQKAKNSYSDLNSYNVNFQSQLQKQEGIQNLLCQLKQQAQIRTLDGVEEPFASLGWRQLVPSQPLEKLSGTPYKTCAVVSSAGAILRSSLGKEIDSHDAVLRFNSAPTIGYERDVGSKTTIRILNSQAITAFQNNFVDKSLYKNIALVGWDPAPYSVDLHKWYKNPDFDLFTAYADYRRRFPNQPFYILHPTFTWGLWDMLQANTDEKIQPNPPSSGFIGIVLMMTLCETVDIYEFIPSRRHTTLCHYYSGYRDMACTVGAYHPLLYEKLLIKKMSTSPLREILETGRVTMPGFSQITCPP